MLSLVLVDDEKLDREGLYNQIEWNKFGICEVYAAKSGREALEIMNEHKIDILLTDISMPGMSGLELINHAKELQPSIKCALISGYNDFSYAQKAIKLEVYEYILKPVLTSDLEEMLARIVKDINMEVDDKQKRLLVENKADYAEFINQSQDLLERVNQEIAQSMEAANINHLNEYIQSVFDTMDIDRSSTQTTLRNLCIYVITRIQHTLIEKNIQTNYLEESQIWEKVAGSNTSSSLKVMLADYFMEISQQLSDYREKNQRTVASEVINYIRNHYSEDITLKTIALKMHYSPNHLGLLFKEATGKTFYEYLTKYRMEIAAQLLMNPANYIYEVAEKVSYKNTIAFSNQFKKEYGVMPSEYSARYRR
jgi:two-component system response regulator YesN